MSLAPGKLTAHNAEVNFSPNVAVLEHLAGNLKVEGV
jgi:hypothetical protein